MNADKTVSGTFSASGGGGGTAAAAPERRRHLAVERLLPAGQLPGTRSTTTSPRRRARSRPKTSSTPTTLNQVTEVALSTRHPGRHHPTASRAWFYMDTAPGQTVRADVIWGGAVRGTTTVRRRASYAWRSINVVPPDQAARSTTCGSASRSRTAGYRQRRRLRDLLRADHDRRRRPAPAHPDRDPAHRHRHRHDHRAPGSTAPGTAPRPTPTAPRSP